MVATRQQDEIFANYRDRVSAGTIPPELDYTCCHRAICCPPFVRNANVKASVIPCYNSSLTWEIIFWSVTSASVVGFIYAILYFLIGDAMLPGRNFFGLFLIIVCSYALGWLLAFIPYLNLPPVFGMLLAGMIIRNTKIYNIHDELGPGVTAKIRTFCLTFIMLRAGLQLTTSALRTNKRVLLLLALIPCTVELIAGATFSWLLLDYPVGWALLAGAVLACMSPVVTVNCILALADKGYGEDKSIVTLLCTATSIDDVHIVALFAITYSWVFGEHEMTDHWWKFIPSGARDLALGSLFGTVIGMFLIFFPHRRHKHASAYRIACLALSSLMCTHGAAKFAITGGGFLATVLSAFIASTGWRIIAVPFDIHPLRKASQILWHFTQPVLVGVIGADIDLRHWSILRVILYLSVIIIGLGTRMLSVFIVTIRTHFTMKERLFIALAWLPKGTLQAALAPMAFEQAVERKNAEEIAIAADVVRLAVVTIILLAPLGAIIIMATGPHLLNKVTDEDVRRYRELSDLQLRSLQPVRNRNFQNP